MIDVCESDFCATKIDAFQTRMPLMKNERNAS